MKTQLTWHDRVPIFSIHPDAAYREDVAKMAADWMAYRHELERLMHQENPMDMERIRKVLELE